MTYEQAEDITLMVAARYPVPAWTTRQIELYAELITDLDFDVAKAVAMDWMRSSSERLDCADLRRMIVERHAKASSVSLPAPDEAWGQVLAEITRVGSYGEPSRLHALTRMAVDSMGWRTLCMSTNQMADRAHFLQLYRGILERTMRESAASAGALPQLPAPPTKEPVQIGKVITGELEDKRPETAALLRDLRKRLGGAVQGAAERIDDGRDEPPTVEDAVTIARREDRKRLPREQREAIEKGAVH
jgi:hypothetical protein